MTYLTASGRALVIGSIISGSVFLGDQSFMEALPLFVIGLGLTAVAVIYTQD